MKIIELESEDLEKFKDNNFIIHFSSLGFLPCKEIKPLIQNYLKNYESECIYIHCNVDKFNKLAEKFNVKNIPAFMVYHKDIDTYSELFPSCVLNNIINFLVRENIVKSNLKHNTKPMCNT